MVKSSSDPDLISSVNRMQSIHFDMRRTAVASVRTDVIAINLFLRLVLWHGLIFLLVAILIRRLLPTYPHSLRDAAILCYVLWPAFIILRIRPVLKIRPVAELRCTKNLDRITRSSRRLSLISIPIALWSHWTAQAGISWAPWIAWAVSFVAGGAIIVPTLLILSAGRKPKIEMLATAVLAALAILVRPPSDSQPPSYGMPTSRRHSRHSSPQESTPHHRPLWNADESSELHPHKRQAQRKGSLQPSSDPYSDGRETRRWIMIEDHESTNGSPGPGSDRVTGADFRSLKDAQRRVPCLPMPTDVAFRRIVGIP
ncbi:MAG: hypothetical protein KDK97_16035 [Verrucomicrobiales bacterium]|nr:hypothetical protein [Verrucomicrobiales bacterium]MCP5560266.1 hypothetical protein [Verrucomicrobiaceae bacterium]